jgi:hypothetical protein
VAGKIVKYVATPDLTFAENYLGPAPAKPKNGYKLDLTIAVDSIVKGDGYVKALELRWLYDPTDKGSYNAEVGIAFGKRVYVGWLSESAGQYKGLMIVLASDEPLGRATTAPSQ